MLTEAIDGAVDGYAAELTWDSSADLDLIVESATGQRLEPDDDVLEGPGTERVSLEGAPDGVYTVSVRHYSGPAASYTLNIETADGTDRHSGSVSSGTEEVATIQIGSGGDPGGGDPGGGTGGTTVLLDEPNLSGSRGSSTPFTITVPPGATRLVVTTGETQYGRNLGDLFVSHGQRPQVQNNSGYTWTAQCASVSPNREPDQCVFNNPQAGQWHIVLFGYHEYYGATLRAVVTR